MCQTRRADLSVRCQDEGCVSEDVQHRAGASEGDYKQLIRVVDGHEACRVDCSLAETKSASNSGMEYLPGTKEYDVLLELNKGFSAGGLDLWTIASVADD
jgi:hypothetical protein